MNKTLKYPVKINEWASRYSIPLIKLANDYDNFIYNYLKNELLLTEFRDNFNFMIFEFDSRVDIDVLKELVNKYDKQFEVSLG